MAALCFGLFLAASIGHPSSTPQELADEVLRRFAAGHLDAFTEIMPFPEQRDLLLQAVGWNVRLVPGLGRVLQRDGDRATILLSGYPKTSNSGDDAVLSRAFAGIYDAHLDGGEWKLTSFHRIGELNRIERQRLRVRVVPETASLRIVDDLRVDVVAPYGFAVRLNPKAHIESVRWNGKASRFAFGGAVLWVSLAQHARGTLSIRYRLEDIEQGPDSTGAGNFLRRAGHVRNEYFWHPFFDFDSANDRAVFVIDAEIPKAFALTTSLPQTERIVGAHRIVHGVGASPTMALTLAYARDWHLQTLQGSDFVVQLFASNEFTPAPAEVLEVYRETIQMMKARFHALEVPYFGVTQTESRAGGGWQFTSNSVVFTGSQGGGPPFRNDSYPRAFLSHEIAHRYTAGTGPGANLLQEGWARFVESIVLGSKYGADTEHRYWKALADDYFAHADGKSTLLDDRANSGIAYTKGAWIFRMVESAMGTERFDRGMRAFISNCQSRPQSVEEFISTMQSESPPGVDITSFLEPWLRGKSAPKVESHLDNGRLTITQTGATFSGPITVQLNMDREKQREQLMICGPEATIDVGSGVRSVVIDPEETLLLRR
jgi:hypothetical protein